MPFVVEAAVAASWRLPELAKREEVALATLDEASARAARAEGVRLIGEVG